MNTTTHAALGPLHVAVKRKATAKSIRRLTDFTLHLHTGGGTVLGSASGYVARRPITSRAAQDLLEQMEAIDADHAFCASYALIGALDDRLYAKGGRPSGLLYITRVEIDPAYRGMGLGHFLLAHLLVEGTQTAEGPTLVSGRAGAPGGYALPDQGAIDSIVAQSPLYDTGDRSSAGVYGYVDAAIAAANLRAGMARLQGSPVLTPSLMADCVVESLETMRESPILDIYVQNPTLAALKDQTTPLRLSHVCMDDGRLVQTRKNVRRLGRPAAVWALAANAGAPVSDRDPWSNNTRPERPRAA